MSFSAGWARCAGSGGRFGTAAGAGGGVMQPCKLAAKSNEPQLRASQGRAKRGCCAVMGVLEGGEGGRIPRVGRGSGFEGVLVEADEGAGGGFPHLGEFLAGLGGLRAGLGDHDPGGPQRERHDHERPVAPHQGPEGGQGHAGL